MRIHEILADLFEPRGSDSRLGDQPSVDDIILALGSRSFGIVLVLFGLPNLLPVPGLPILCGFIIGIIAFQMVIGKDHLLLPRWVGQRRLKREDLSRVVQKATPTLRKVESLMRRRLVGLTTPLMSRVVGGVLLVLATALMAPIPFFGGIAPTATKRNAYAHHIQRLMVTGNFALLAGIAPREIEEWYLLVYADAFEWVELPNVHGMVMFADGGLLASKPYAASGAYIDRMSDYCTGCRYDPNVKSGPKACPFNPLYWNFLIENEKKLANNPRMAMPYRNLQRFPPERRAEITRDATAFLDKVAPRRDQ